MWVGWLSYVDRVTRMWIGWSGTATSWLRVIVILWYRSFLILSITRPPCLEWLFYMLSRDAGLISNSRGKQSLPICGMHIFYNVYSENVKLPVSLQFRCVLMHITKTFASVLYFNTPSWRTGHEQARERSLCGLTSDIFIRVIQSSTVGRLPYAWMVNHI